jgi:hypothetical protein
LISVSIDIPKARIFRFKNYWMLHVDFMNVFQHGWNIPAHHQDKAKMIGAKFKNLRRVLKCLHSKLSNLAAMVTNTKLVIFLLDSMEEFRDLSVEVWNFRQLVQRHLVNLLEQQRAYWRQRGRIKWATRR